MGPSSRWGWVIAGSVCALALIGCCLCSILDPSRRSEAVIRDEILKATPIGTTEDFVDRYAKSRFKQDNFFTWVRDDDRKILMVCYGCYATVENFPYSTCVRITWSFDKDGKLTAVTASKWVDAP